MVGVVGKVDKNLDASVRQNTSKSSAAALSHCVTWGGFLPQWCDTLLSTLTKWRFAHSCFTRGRFCLRKTPNLRSRVLFIDFRLTELRA